MNKKRPELVDMQLIPNKKNFIRTFFACIYFMCMLHADNLLQEATVVDPTTVEQYEPSDIASLDTDQEFANQEDLQDALSHRTINRIIIEGNKQIPVEAILDRLP